LTPLPKTYWKIPRKFTNRPHHARQRGDRNHRGVKKSHPDIKIVAISGGGKVGPENHLVLADALGADATLKKPFSIQELLLSLKLVD